VTLPPNPALCFELQEVREQRSRRHSMKLDRIRAVYLRHQLLRRLRPTSQALKHLLLSRVPVIDVFADLRLAVPHRRTVARVENSRAQLEHPPERIHVVPQVPLGGIYHARAPPEDGIPSEHRARQGLVEDDVIG
jgi:hypothetical protein